MDYINTENDVIGSFSKYLTGCSCFPCRTRRMPIAWVASLTTLDWAFLALSIRTRTKKTTDLRLSLFGSTARSLEC